MLFLWVISGLLGMTAAQKAHEWTLEMDEDFTNKGVMLAGFTTRHLSFVRYPVICARMCHADPSCKSFNFNLKTRMCELNSANHIQQPAAIVKNPTYLYFDRNWYKIDREAMGACAKTVCNKGSLCVEICDKDGFSFAKCVCYGDKRKNTNCENKAEAIWSEWAPWQQCSKTCGVGLASRTRICTHPFRPLVNLSSQNCEGLDTDIGACDLGKCPAFSPWSAWSSCSSHFTCGKGVKTRGRTCVGGKVNVDGDCMGPETQEDPCYDQSCDIPIRLKDGRIYGEGRVEIFSEKLDDWGGVCADGWSMQNAHVACRQALNLTGAVEATTGESFGALTKPVLLSNVHCKGNEGTIQSCPHDGWEPKEECESGAAGVKCVVDGQWSTWGEWSECSVSCDWGYNERIRTCDNPAPMNGGKQCEGSLSSQRKKCYMVICPIHGIWMEWSSYGPCSLSCGGGVRYRNRTCDGPYYNGDDCSTEPEGEIGVDKCNTQRCPFRNCQEYKIVDETTKDDFYLVDPDGPYPQKAFNVFCIMNTDGPGITVIHHNSEDRSKVQGYEGRGDYRRKLNYKDADVSQVTTLVDTSVECEQFVNWECSNAAIHELRDTYVLGNTLALTYVEGRGQELDYFPGGEPGTYSCACWNQKNCTNKERWCNCDSDQQALDRDEGYVTELKDLPVTDFYAGDTGGSGEVGYHTIGPLRCWGTTRPLRAGQNHPMETATKAPQ